ncbi:L-aspartate oxidase [Chelativorans sp. AA-79]|uniref:L-aspartate oxidase n=1 Tax=Chelativorans sp. AA-79 TaxID=3028735 RepID=UPI0023F95347|nr:L-aspartate oxidase [Chelativorans sp. AA-79]WEX10582.1 L-aspartate oxidase [Chelativorans sp. AA-79]
MNGIDLRDLGGRPVIVGAGLAGLATALHLSPAPVVVLSKAPLGQEASSGWAQGGLAAAMGADDDPELHRADTLAAGDGLCDPEIVGKVVSAAPRAVEDLARFGVRFDRGPDGALLLGLEAAHSRRRIVHAEGDATGREIMRALVAAVRRTPSITVLEGFEARRLVTDDGAVSGVVASGPSGPVLLAAGRVVVATGSIGGLYDDATTPLGSIGQGLALAARAGAALRDLEFVQFHPTALDGANRPMRLVSEAVRGEGAILIDETDRRFLAGVPGAELAPRDVVARAVAAHLAQGHRVYLDARGALGGRFARRFPGIDASCKAAGIDPSRQPIPIRPAVHYHMGGIAVDGEGRSSVSGLWACGEAASTGLHGANRLASNSLIEAAVFGRCVAESIAGTADRLRPRPVSLPTAARVDASAVRPIVSRALGVSRDGETLRDAVAALLPFIECPGPASDPAAIALMMAVSALAREESRGAHFRSDFPDRNSRAVHTRLTLEQALAAARNLALEPAASLARSA